MKNSILNLEGAVALTRKQMSTINGSLAEGGGCRLYVRPKGGGAGYWSVEVSLEQAQSQWDNFVYNDGSYATGYCCASCA